jgi:hypothetical protein
MNNAKEVQDNYMDNLYNLIEEEEKERILNKRKNR